MHVIFHNVSYEGRSLVWELDQESNRAHLIFTQEDGTIQNKEIIIAFLRNNHADEGLIFIGDHVVVSNAEVFSALHPMQKLIEPPSHPNSSGSNPALESPKERSYSPRAAEIYGGKSESGHFFRTTQIRKVCPSSVELNDSKRQGYRFIDLENLILEVDDSSVYRNTLAVTSSFQEITEKKRKQVTGYMRTNESFYLEAQYTKNNELYPIKGRLIGVIRELFNGSLNFFYSRWAENASIDFRRQLYFFMQNTVNMIMQNAPLNHTPTEFDSLSALDLQEKFNGNSALHAFAINKQRAARAEVILVNLTYLIDSSLPVDLVVSLSKQDLDYLLQCYKEILPVYKYLSISSAIDESLKDWVLLLKSIVNKIKAVIPFDDELKNELAKILSIDHPEEVPRFKDFSSAQRRAQLLQAERIIDSRMKRITLISFKKCLSEHPDLRVSVQKQLQTMQEYMVKVSEVEYRFKLITDGLNKQLSEDEQMINGYYSLKHVLITCLTNRFKEKIKNAAECMTLSVQISEMMISKTIIALNQSSSKAILEVTPKLPRTCDKNFYLSEEWVANIGHIFDLVDCSLLLKNPSKLKVIEQYSQSFAHAFELFISAKSTKIVGLSDRDPELKITDSIKPTSF